MITRHAGGGMAYSSDFLGQMVEDLRQLAVDYEKCGGSTGGARKLLTAGDVVARIKADNEHEQELAK